MCLIQYYISLRPGLKNFVKKLSKHFELVIFNSDNREFTDAVFKAMIEILDCPKSLKLTSSQSVQENNDDAFDKYLEQFDIDEKMKDSSETIATRFSHVLSQEQCSINELNHEVKVLDLFTGGDSLRSLENCIMVDNNVFCFQRNLSNGIIIPKFQGDPKDRFLKSLKNYLIKNFIKEHKGDVKQVISDDFQVSLIMESSRVSQIKQMMNKHISIESFNEAVRNEQRERSDSHDSDFSN